MFKIAAIVGSLRKESINKKFMRALDKLAHPDLAFQTLKLDDVPLFNQDHEDNLPTPVVTLKTAIAEADGLLFVTPEYNRSIPGVLKNIIDWGTRPSGQNVWKNKPTAIVGTSKGSVGTAVAQSHLRSIMVPLGIILMGRPEVYFVLKDGLIDDADNMTDENTKKFLQGFLDNFSQWMHDHKK